MNPAFFAPQLRTFIPLFLNEALKVRHLIHLDVNQPSGLRGFAARPKVEGRSCFPAPYGAARHQYNYVALTRSLGHHWRRSVLCRALVTMGLYSTLSWFRLRVRLP
jgi:hypothetical protein